LAAGVVVHFASALLTSASQFLGVCLGFCFFNPKAEVEAQTNTTLVTLGISNRIPKFNLDMSTVPKAKPLRICSTKLLSIGQNFLKKATGNPSGLGAVSVLVSLRTSSSSRDVKDLIMSAFSSSQTMLFSP
jgi:hypothetical protein